MLQKATGCCVARQCNSIVIGHTDTFNCVSFRFIPRVICVTGQTLDRCIFKTLGQINCSELRHINIAAKIHFLQLFFIRFWNICKMYVFMLKFKAPWPLLFESVMYLLTPPYLFFTKIKIKKVSWQNFINFLSEVLKKFTVREEQLGNCVWGWKSLIFAFWRCPVYKKVLKIKFTELKNPCAE